MNQQPLHTIDPGLQRYVIACKERERAQAALVLAQREMEAEERAARKIIDVGGRRRVELIDGTIVTVYRDTAGLFWTDGWDER